MSCYKENCPTGRLLCHITSEEFAVTEGKAKTAVGDHHHLLSSGPKDPHRPPTPLNSGVEVHYNFELKQKIFRPIANRPA